MYNIRAICTWGDGPDILLILEPDKDLLMLYHDPIAKDIGIHGFCKDGSIPLSIQQAQDLARSLLDAVNKTIQLETSYEQYMIKESENAR